MAQLLEGFSGGLLASLKEVLVERNKLTLGKELGRGQLMIARKACVACVVHHIHKSSQILWQNFSGLCILRCNEVIDRERE